MIYVIGGTMKAAEHYCREGLKMSPRSIGVRVMSVATVLRSGSLRGTQFKQHDRIIFYAWHLARPSECFDAEAEVKFVWFNSEFGPEKIERISSI